MYEMVLPEYGTDDMWRRNEFCVRDCADVQYLLSGAMSWETEF
jgi:hypothetical protein